jgi:SAM-dependent methyltransferase
VVGRPTFAESLALRIFRRYPSKTTIFRDLSDDASFEYRDEREHPFWGFFGRGPELFVDRDVLDLGCGWGGRSVRWLEVGAKSMVGVDVAESQISLARAFATDKGIGNEAMFMLGVGEEIQCADDSFDLVVMYDVMEHVVSPEGVLAECYRVLRPGGRVATVFPPYYDLFGGSHLHGYATSVPGLNLVFSTKTLKGATLRLFAEQGIDHRPYLRDIPSDKLWNQNGLTISGFENIVARSQFEVEQLWLRSHIDRRFVDQPASSRWRAILRPVAFAASDAATRTPLVRETLCSRICAVLHKPDEPKRRPARAV